ncbi:hypothetical protein F5X68DRAFT_38180 [Plectosphaerella plurivora]|uniref:C2H2-type domain-containing protein n=1 Tax=Plectosphaerella plurivora TaxID=936078 RepID=A0A9P9A5D9_9PEZI|nr:hypothetical protein F5X68DRAFT_38180 [Plectosphaerella plurivora]
MKPSREKSTKKTPGLGHPTKSWAAKQSTLDKFFRPQVARPLQAPVTAKAPDSNSIRPSHAISTPAVAKPQTPASARIAVVLPSPGLHASHYADLDELDEDVAPANLISDLSPQFRRLAAQAAKSVSLSNHSIAYGESADEPDELAQPRAKLQSRTQKAHPPKKRGRPKGYRPSLGKIVQDADHIATVRKKEGARPQRAADKGTSYYLGPPKRKGRPAKGLTATPREIYDALKPEFIRFICEWEGCKAELHNLETLERHTKVVHVKATTARECPASCRWGKCRVPRDSLSARTFGTPEELQRHVDEAHMSLQRWYVGDGPKVPAPGEAAKLERADDDVAVPAYLLDKDGNQVTPWIRDQKEEDMQTYRDRKRKLKSLQLEWDKNAPDEGEVYDEDLPDADEDRLYG